VCAWGRTQALEQWKLISGGERTEERSWTTPNGGGHSYRIGRTVTSETWSSSADTHEQSDTDSQDHRNVSATDAGGSASGGSGRGANSGVSSRERDGAEEGGGGGEGRGSESERSRLELERLLEEAGLGDVATRIIESTGLVEASDVSLLQSEDVVELAWLKPVQRRKLLALCERVRQQQHQQQVCNYIYINTVSETHIVAGTKSCICRCYI